METELSRPCNIPLQYNTESCLSDFYLSQRSLIKHWVGVVTGRHVQTQALGPSPCLSVQEQLWSLFYIGFSLNCHLVGFNITVGKNAHNYDQYQNWHPRLSWAKFPKPSWWGSPWFKTGARKGTWNWALLGKVTEKLGLPVYLWAGPAQLKAPHHLLLLECGFQFSTFLLWGCSKNIALR